MPILKSIIKNELAGTESLRQFIQNLAHVTDLSLGEQSDSAQPFSMSLAGPDIELKKLSIENDVLPRQEAHDLIIDRLR